MHEAKHDWHAMFGNLNGGVGSRDRYYDRLVAAGPHASESTISAFLALNLICCAGIRHSSYPSLRCLW